MYSALMWKHVLEESDASPLKTPGSFAVCIVNNALHISARIAE
jgi:hypothetical protein